MQHSKPELEQVKRVRLIIGMSGASGAIYGVRLLQVLQQESSIETHLIMSDSAKLNIAVETEFSSKDVQALADQVHSNKDIGATIASGSISLRRNDHCSMLYKDTVSSRELLR